MSARWVVERKYINTSRDVLQLIEVYASGENKELVKKENKNWTHKRSLIVVD